MYTFCSKSSSDFCKIFEKPPDSRQKLRFAASGRRFGVFKRGALRRRHDSWGGGDKKKQATKKKLRSKTAGTSGRQTRRFRRNRRAMRGVCALRIAAPPRVLPQATARQRRRIARRAIGEAKGRIARRAKALFIKRYKIVINLQNSRFLRKKKRIYAPIADNFRSLYIIIVVVIYIVFVADAHERAHGTRFVGGCADQMFH